MEGPAAKAAERAPRPARAFGIGSARFGPRGRGVSAPSRRGSVTYAG